MSVFEVQDLEGKPGGLKCDVFVENFIFRVPLFWCDGQGVIGFRGPCTPLVCKALKPNLPCTSRV